MSRAGAAAAQPASWIRSEVIVAMFSIAALTREARRLGKFRFSAP